MECSFAFEGTPLKISLETDPALPEIDLTAPGKSAVGDFDLEVEVQRPGPDSQLLTWRLRRSDGAPFEVTGFSANAEVPGLDLHRMFVPALYESIGKRDLISLPWGLTEPSFISWSFPFVAALNRVDTPQQVDVQIQEIIQQRHDAFGDDVGEPRPGLMDNVDLLLQKGLEELTVGVHSPEVGDVIPAAVQDDVDVFVQQEAHLPEGPLADDVEQLLDEAGIVVASVDEILWLNQPGRGVPQGDERTFEKHLLVLDEATVGAGLLTVVGELLRIGLREKIPQSRKILLASDQRPDPVRHVEVAHHGDIIGRCEVLAGPKDVVEGSGRGLESLV